MTNVKNLLANAFVDKGLELAVAILLILFAAAMLRHILLRKITDPERRRRLRKGISRGTIGLILVSSAIIFASNLGSLGVSLGVASAGIAFALQSVIANAAARLANVTGAYFEIGDRVQLGGVTGDVISINMMVTTLMEIGGWVKADQYSGRIVHVSNSSIFTAPVYNYSGEFPILWDEITLPIKYGGERALVVEILTRVVTEETSEATELARAGWLKISERYALENARLEPLVTLVANDNWLEYNVRYVVPFNQRRVTKDRLFNRIMDEFDKVPERIGIASSTYDIVAFPPLTIRSEGEAKQVAT